MVDTPDLPKILFGVFAGPSLFEMQQIQSPMTRDSGPELQSKVDSGGSLRNGPTVACDLGWLGRVLADCSDLFGGRGSKMAPVGLAPLEGMVRSTGV